MDHKELVSRINQLEHELRFLQQKVKQKFEQNIVLNDEDSRAIYLGREIKRVCVSFSIENNL